VSPAFGSSFTSLRTTTAAAAWRSESRNNLLLSRRNMGSFFFFLLLHLDLLFFFCSAGTLIAKERVWTNAQGDCNEGLPRYRRR
jgi:hypothetical protein